MSCMDSGPNDGAPSLAGVHVLLVEDDPRFADVLAAVLEWRGALVTVASPEAALRLVGTVVPSVLVVGTSPLGAAVLLTAARRAFGRQGARQVPAVMVTAPRRGTPRDALTAPGFQACLVKPIELGEFCRVVRRLAAGRTTDATGAPRPPPPSPLSSPWLLP
jgi:CheY-like chemotaxis protein